MTRNPSLNSTAMSIEHEQVAPPFMRNAWLVAWLLILASGCVHTDPAVKRLFDREREPAAVIFGEAGGYVPLFQDGDGRPYVEVMVGDTNLLLLVDTGTPLILLDSKIAKSQHIALTPGAHRIATPEGLAPCQAAVIPELRVGCAVVQEVTAAFMDLASWSALAGKINGRAVNGALGGTVLFALGAKIDFAAGRLVMRPPEIHAGSATVSLQKGKGFRRYVEVEINGRRGLLVLDSGANSIMLDWSFARDNGVSFGWSGHSQTLGTNGVAQARRVISGTIPELRIGPVSFSNVSAFIENASYAKETRNAGRRVVGFLGSKFLSEHGMAIDFGRECLILGRQN